MNSKAMIVGCGGLSLSGEERAFFSAEQPWGYILFARNIDNPVQVAALCSEMREISGRQDVPIFLDQEGGRVQRLRPPHWTNYPPAASFGALYRQDPEAGRRAVWLLSRLHAFDMLSLGLNVDCLPVLDVPVEGAHDVIGDRAYGNEPEIVADLGRAACDGLMAGGVMPVIKHIPGHGRANADTHFDLPVVDAPLEDLERHDFTPFRALNEMPMAMTAHVIYAAVDPENCATTSPEVVEKIIRGHIGFDGLLMSDDVSMQALSGSFDDRTKAIFAAGCDVVLHCNGDMAEMMAVAARTPVLEGRAQERAAAAIAGIGKAGADDEAGARDEFASLIGSVAAA